MIVFVFGTSAEAIKVAPIARRLSARGVTYQMWLTMFHGENLLKTIQRLGFVGAPVIIPNGNKGDAVQSPWQTVKWIVAMFAWLAKNSHVLRKKCGKNSLLIVHGDTLTTVVGVIFARLLGISSAHVEAGLRSGNWRHPFPEELDRRIAGTLATIHYAPSEEAFSNLARKPNVVYTHGNTVIDAVVDATTGKSRSSKGSERYGVCLLHRFEFLGNPDLIRATLKELAGSTPVPIRIYLDSFSGSVLTDELDRLNSPLLVARPKLPYEEFIYELTGADFVFTDSGGIQAECAMLGVPTLIHRKATEQREGVGQNISLSNWNLASVRNFLAGYSSYRVAPSKPTYSPTKIILDDLSSRGFVHD